MVDLTKDERTAIRELRDWCAKYSATIYVRDQDIVLWFHGQNILEDKKIRLGGVFGKHYEMAMPFRWRRIDNEEE